MIDRGSAPDPPPGMIAPPLDPDRARTLVSRFSTRSVLVVGDVMLDHFVIGRVTRISPEAPVPVVAYQREEYRLGGAANVANNLRSLGATVALAGVSGHDAARDRLLAELERSGISANAVVPDPERCTTIKQRIVTDRNQQVARVDFEADRDLTGPPETALFDALARAVRDADVVLVSDYLKGCVTAGLMSRLLVTAHARGIPVLVDPKIPHISRYRGADLVTPNHQEAEVATHCRIRTSDEAGVAAREFQQRVGCGSVMITRGEHGMWLLDGTGTQSVETDIPATAREVADVTGAGDTVIATIALSLATSSTLLEAAQLANVAAGIVVGKFGPAVVTPEELTADLNA